MTMIPPAAYDHPPTIPVIERVMGWDEVSAFCSKAAHRILMPGEHISGCSGMGTDGKCYVVMIDDRTVRRHELAHCNGWPKDHPGGWGR